MAEFDFRCKRCDAIVTVRGKVGETPAAPHCTFCDEQTMTRVYSAQGFIMRPLYYNTKPGDKMFSNFDRNIELGEARNPDQHSKLSAGATPSSNPDFLKDPFKGVKFDEQKRKNFIDAAKAEWNRANDAHEW
jgi:hypothetical protein